MAHTLAPHKHIAFIDGSTVILDLMADRYSLLGSRQTAVLQTLAAGEPVTDQPAIEALYVQGLLIAGGGPVAGAAFCRPSRSALELPPVGVCTLPLVRVLTAVLRARFMLRVGGLARVLFANGVRARASTMTGKGGNDCEDALVELAQSYTRQRRRLPTAPICLCDSIALRHLLSRAGLSCSLVVAVRLAPFAAHCWLQAGDLLLNDSCDGVSGYTPILVL